MQGQATIPLFISTDYEGGVVNELRLITGERASEAAMGATGNPAAIAAAVEFVLEGLHLNRKLNKERGETRSTFRA